MLPTLGIDISKASFHVELSLNEKLRHRKFSNRKEGFSELGNWLVKHKVKQVHACLEATGPYSEELAVYLHQQGHTVSIVNPLQIKAFGQSELLRNKDDRPDAGLIRRFCEKQRPPAWTPRSSAPRNRSKTTLTAIPILNSNASCWSPFPALANGPPPSCWLKSKISATTNQRVRWLLTRA